MDAPMPLPMTAPGRVVALPDGERGGDRLLTQFSDFFAELLRLKYSLSAGRLGAWAGGGGKDREIPGPAELAGLAHQRLRLLLEAQATRARHRGGAYGEALYQEAQYVMAALADETMLLRVNWDGRAAWQDNLLETALFGSRIAGERVFERLDALVADSSRASPELATIYLTALALGFRGRYWRPEDEGDLRRYRVALARIIVNRDPELARANTHLFEQAYGHTITQGRPVRLPHLRPWYLALAAVLAVFLVGGHALWLSATANVERAISHIDDALLTQTDR
jgi:type VI secretion system protein ImpK